MWRGASAAETGTRNGVKQKTEAERSNMVVEFNHLLPVMPELGMGLPNTYARWARSLIRESSSASSTSPSASCFSAGESAVP